MSKAERQREIVSILSIQKSDKIENLAFKLDVSARTIMNDLIELTPYYPIDVVQGRNGGVFWDRYKVWKDTSMIEEMTLLQKYIKKSNDEEEREVLKRILKKVNR